jgi:hypothetical protein
MFEDQIEEATKGTVAYVKEVMTEVFKQAECVA